MRSKFVVEIILAYVRIQGDPSRGKIEFEASAKQCTQLPTRKCVPNCSARQKSPYMSLSRMYAELFQHLSLTYCNVASDLQA